MKLAIAFLFLALVKYASSQHNSDIQLIGALDSLNRAIDRAVVKKDLPFLNKYYAVDFVFTHGTGLVDSKDSWINNIATSPAKFISREHDSTTVELHRNFAIIVGTLTVHRTGEKDNMYALRYVRVFAKRKKTWQLVSHRTTAEWHL